MTPADEPTPAVDERAIRREDAPETTVPPAVPVLPWSHSLRPSAGEVAAAVRVAIVLLLAGLPLAVLWWALAPRREYAVSAEGAFAVVPESEAAVGTDGWFMLLTGAVALVGAAVVWRRGLRRGPVILLGLAAGMLLCGLLAWQLGSLLAPRPSAAELADVGAVVLGPLGLRAHGVLVVGPFLAVAGYLLAVCFTPHDDLRPSRPGGSSGRDAPASDSPRSVG